jgi:hypothetical protein
LRSRSAIRRSGHGWTIRRTFGRPHRAAAPDPSFEGEIIFSTDDTFDVGEDWGTPVSPTYEPPFTFTGILKRVTGEAKGS